jgi:hypothetical protein
VAASGDFEADETQVYWAWQANALPWLPYRLPESNNFSAVFFLRSKIIYRNVLKIGPGQW